MSLRETTVADIVDATRQPNAPIVHVVGNSEQRATLELFEKELRIKGVGSYFLPMASSKGLNIKVDLNVSELLSETDLHYNWYYHYLELLFVDDTLQMKCGYNSTMRPVADVSHIERIVEAMKTRLQGQWKRKQKRMKIHDLHVRGVEVQVMSLAKRLDLSCRLERLHTQLWICIFDSPIEAGVDAYIPLDESPHDHFAKFERKVLGFHQRQQKRARRQSARER